MVSCPEFITFLCRSVFSHLDVSIWVSLHLLTDIWIISLWDDSLIFKAAGWKDIKIVFQVFTVTLYCNEQPYTPL